MIKRNIRFWHVCATVSLLMMVLGFLYCINYLIDANVIDDERFNVVSYVDGIPVTYGEYLIYEGLNEEIAMDQAVTVKRQQILMQEHNVVTDISYSNFLELLEQENRRRKEVLDDDGVIFGPQQYTEKVYYRYLHSIRMNTLINVLGEQFGDEKSDELHAVYEIMIQRDLRMKVPDTYIVEVLDIPSATIIEQITYDPQRQMQESKMGGPFKSLIADLEEGDLSEPYLHNDLSQRFRCVKRIDNGYLSYEEAKPLVIREYVEELSKF